MAEIAYITEKDFPSEVLNSTLPVMVDFTAVWCGPCKMVDPIIIQLARDWDGKVKVLKCDADENPNLLIQYGIMGIPTVMMFKNGQVVERVTGYQPKEKLVGRMSAHF